MQMASRLSQNLRAFNAVAIALKFIFIFRQKLTLRKQVLLPYCKWGIRKDGYLMKS